MRALIARLRSTGAREVLDLLRAQAALLRARRRVAREPVGALAIRSPVAPNAALGDRERAYALALAVQRAARFGLFRPFCLVQALALRDLLEANAITGSSIRIGVRRHEGEFQAHAWVVWGRLVLGDRVDHVRRFTEVDDLRVVEPR